jgi:5-(carboxyamino)imidazole ribonucleotide mutase
VDVVSAQGDPRIGIVMGSVSDLETMLPASEMLDHFDIPHEVRVVSAHRTPDHMANYARTAAGRGLRAVIAGAGGSAHLPGMLASETYIPVLGVAVGSDDLHAAVGSQVRMPKGKPLAFLGSGRAGAANAALFAVRMLALHDEELARRYQGFDEEMAAEVMAIDEELRLNGPERFRQQDD